MTELPPVAAVLSLPALALSSTLAYGGGFAVDYEGARAVGMATAGSASAADASTIFYNPAGLAYLERNEFLAGAQFLTLRDQFENDFSTMLGGALPSNGTNGLNAIPPSVVPWLYANQRLTSELSVGLGIFSPFGLRSDYGSDWVGRYQNEVSSLTDITLNPTVAYRPLRWLSLGAGLDVQYAHVRLTQAIDFGSVCAAALGAQICGARFALLPGRSDGQVDNRGDSFGYGYNVGVLAEFIPGTRLGIAYRSGIDQQFRDARQSFVIYPTAQAFLAGAPLAFTGSTITTSLPFPARLSFGLKQKLLEKLDLLLDATLTFWSVFQSTNITAKNPAAGASVAIQQGYMDAWRFAAGLEYRNNQRWSFRSGVAYDQTPIPISRVQAALPDRDRVYLSAGVSYEVRSDWSVDFGYSHLFWVGRVPIDRATLSGDRLNGSFTVGGDVFAAQLRFRY